MKLTVSFFFFFITQSSQARIFIKESKGRTQGAFVPSEPHDLNSLGLRIRLPQQFFAPSLFPETSVNLPQPFPPHWGQSLWHQTVIFLMSLFHL